MKTTHTRGNEMAKTIKAKAWIAYDASGQVVIAETREIAEERWQEDCCGNYHLRCLEMEIPVPRVITQRVSLPESEEEELIVC